MSQTAYSDLKALWHVHAIQAMRLGGQIVPKQVQLIICDLCNHDCSFCAYRMSAGFSTEQFADEEGRKNPKRWIPTEKCFEILDDCAALGVKAIQFTGGGEPTVHPDHLRIFAHAQKLGLETSLVTNGYLLRSGWEPIFQKMAWIRVSIDAGTAKTYALVRRLKPTAFERCLSNLQKMVSILRGMPCLFGVGYVLTRENYAELAEGCRLFRRLGVPYVRVSAMFSKEGSAYYEGYRAQVEAACAEAKSLETPSFKVVDLFTDRIDDLDQGSPDYDFCGYQQFNMYIGGNQKVYRCCTTSYTLHGEVGDLSNQRLVTWFDSEQKKRAYGDFKASSCHTCQFNNKNRAINYVLQKKPLHVNFV